MAKTYQALKTEIEQFIDTDLGTNPIKKYDSEKTALETAQEELTKTPDDEAKKTAVQTAQANFDKAKKAYDDGVKRLNNMCKDKVDENSENLKLANYSEKVKDLRKNREIEKIEKEVRELEAEIGILELNVDEQDKKIETLRAGLNASAN